MVEIPDNQYQNPFKKSGQIETEKKLQPLPLTAITEEARERLVSWGLNNSQIEDLRAFTSQFRYDLCLQKIQRMCEQPAELFSINQKYYINIPVFYDTDGRLDGQCGDISSQWIIQINKSGLIKKLNMEKHTSIIPSYYKGLSKTHFCKDGMGHVWNGLTLVDDDGYIVEEIYIDASFQDIHTSEQSDYREDMAIYDTKIVEQSVNTQVAVGWILFFSAYSWKAELPSAIVIGVSPDFEFSYSIGFVKDKLTSKIKPIVLRLLKDGTKEYFVIGNNDEICSSDNAKVTQSQMAEIEELLKAIQNIDIVEKQPTELKSVWKKED